MISAKRHWIICPQQRRQARARLFCFGPAGIGMAAFRGWAEVGSDVEVLCVQLPGRDGRAGQDRFNQMRDLVPELSQQFGDFLDLPYTFYGHSLGALVAFEVARALRRRGEPEPRHLVVGAARAPHVPNPYPPIHRLEERQFLEEIQKRYGGIPSEVMDDAEMRALLTPVLRADVGIIETYQYVQDEPLGCDVVAFGGLRDPMVTRSSLEAWREQTTGDFQLTMIDGDHFFGQSRRLELLGQISNIIRKQGHAAMAARNGMGGVL